MIEQAGPGAIGEETIGATPQQEQLLQRIDRSRHRSGAGKGPIIASLKFARAAMLLNAWKIMIFTQQDEGEALVVAQQDIIGRPETLDKLRLQQQRFRLAVGGHD